MFPSCELGLELKQKIVSSNGCGRQLPPGGNPSRKPTKYCWNACHLKSTIFTLRVALQMLGIAVRAKIRVQSTTS